MDKYFNSKKFLLKKILKLLSLEAWFFNLLNKYYPKPKQDEDFEKKILKIIESNKNFGESDFASICPFLFTPSLQNHGTIHQRIDEASLLWMMVKNTEGKILEIGRAAGGSTILILAASGNRDVVSIDRDPRHLSIANYVFDKLDIKKRLKLYNQSSRKFIDNDKYGFLFVDGDHSYDGICFDIATFWNQLEINPDHQSIAVFHDAQKNPISYVPSVERALKELIEEKAAEKITSWGAQLAIKKIKNIDCNKWYKKIDNLFWIKNNSYLQNNEINPDIKSFSISEERKINYSNNLLGYENLEERTWIKENLTIERVDLSADNPLRFIRKNNTNKLSSLSKSIENLKGKFTINIFLRPKKINSFTLSLEDEKNSNILNILNNFKENHPSIDYIFDEKFIKIIDIKVDYFNAYYHYYYHFELTEIKKNLKIKIILDEKQKNKESGIFLNLLDLDQR